jgi:hypothetical protein
VSAKRATWGRLGLAGACLWQARLAVQAREPHRRRQVVSEHCFDALIATPLKKSLLRKNDRLAPARAFLAEKPWGSIRRDGLPARLGAH